jgi:DNA-binding HxlR family transcriptional regulator
LNVEEKIIQVLTSIPPGVRYSTSDWGRILNEDKREIRRTLGELESSGRISVERDEGRPDKPLYRLT